MSLEVVPYAGEEGAWEEFVRTSNNGTLFHRLRFLSYHPAGRFTSAHLVIRRRGAIVGLVPAVVRGIPEGPVLSSHAGASYGGIVVPPRQGVEEGTRLVAALVDYCAAQGFAGIEMTLPPVFYLERPNNHLDFALLRAGFTYRKRELTAALPLEGTDALLAGCRPEGRTSIRKAQREGVTVEESDDLPAFYQILEKNLWMRHNVRPTHTVAELLLLRTLLPDEIRLYLARREGQPIAGCVVFRANPRVDLAFYISHDEGYQQYRPVNLVIYEGMRAACARGARYWDFGTYTLNMSPNWGLARFKERFGAQGFFRDTLVLRLPGPGRGH